MGELRTYQLKGARLAPANLLRSLKGAAERSDEYGVNAMVSIKPGFGVPAEIETLWRDDELGCGFDLSPTHIGQNGELIGENLQFGDKESLTVTVPIGAIEQLDIAYKEDLSK